MSRIDIFWFCGQFVQSTFTNTITAGWRHLSHLQLLHISFCPVWPFCPVADHDSAGWRAAASNSITYTGVDKNSSCSLHLTPEVSNPHYRDS